MWGVSLHVTVQVPLLSKLPRTHGTREDGRNGRLLLIVFSCRCWVLVAAIVDVKSTLKNITQFLSTVLNVCRKIWKDFYESFCTLEQFVKHHLNSTFHPIFLTLSCLKQPFPFLIDYRNEISVQINSVGIYIFFKNLIVECFK